MRVYVRNIFGFSAIFIGIIFNPWSIRLFTGRHDSFRADTIFKIIIAELTIIAFGIVIIFFFEHLHRMVKQQWKFLLFLFLFSLFSIEVMIRFLYPSQYQTSSEIKSMIRYEVNDKPSKFAEIYASSNYYAYALKQNLNMKQTDTLYGVSQHIVTDNNGFRNHGRVQGKPSIMILGDSVTFGVGVNNDESFPAQLQNLLANEYNVYNFGVGGWGIAEYYLTYQRYAPDIKPKLIVIGLFPANDFADLDNSLWDGKEKGLLPSPPLLRRDVFIDNEEHLRSNDYLYKIPILPNFKSFVLLDRQLIKPVFRLMRMSIDSKQLTLRIIKEIQKSFEGKILILLLPAQYHYPNKYSPNQFRDRLKELSNGVHVIDFYPIIREKYSELYVDGSHFTRNGNDIVARNIQNYIIKNRLLE